MAAQHAPDRSMTHAAIIRMNLHYFAYRKSYPSFFITGNLKGAHLRGRTGKGPCMPREKCISHTETYPKHFGHNNTQIIPPTPPFIECIDSS